MKSFIKGFVISLALLSLLGCTTINQSRSVNLGGITQLAIFPFANNTTTTQASQRAVSMTAHLLTQPGSLQVVLYPASCQSTICQYSSKTQASMRAWALSKHIRYALNGAVNEWRYKVGLDGEPSVSLSLSITDLKTKRVIWSAVGSKAGNSRTSLGGTGLTLLYSMLNNVRW